MKIFCYYCHNAVSTELPKETTFGAYAVCPNCVTKDDKPSLARLDMFAVHAMRGLVALDAYKYVANGNYEQLAFVSFEIARAMIKESAMIADGLRC